MTFVAQNQNAWRVDVSTDGTTWSQVIGITSGNFPGLTGGLKDSSSYDNNGWASQAKTSMSWSLELDLFPKSETGAYAQSYQILNSLQLGFPGTVQVRWGRTDDVTPFEGYTGTGVVSKAPGNTNWDDLRSEKFTIAGAGEAVALTTVPAEWAGTAVPTISSVSPSGAAAAELVTISGANFAGATAVKFGAAAAADFTVLGDSTIVASLPAGTAGSAPVTVVTAAGTSAAFAYTRGA